MVFHCRAECQRPFPCSKANIRAVPVLGVRSLFGVHCSALVLHRSLSMACPITHTLVGGCTGVRVLIKVSKQEQLRRTVCRSSSAGARTVTLKEILYNCPQLLHLELDHSSVSVEGPTGHDSGLLEHLSWVRSTCHASDKP